MQLFKFRVEVVLIVIFYVAVKLFLKARVCDSFLKKVFSFVIVLWDVFRNRHVKIKKPYVYFIIKIFLIENECKAPFVFYTHFLSKIFFMIKWTSGFFIFMCRNNFEHILYGIARSIILSFFTYPSTCICSLKCLV